MKTIFLPLLLAGALVQKGPQPSAPIISLPSCSLSIVGPAARNLIGPNPGTAIPLPTPEPEFCDGRVCDARSAWLRARDAEARAAVEFQRWQALDLAIRACGF